MRALGGFFVAGALLAISGCDHSSQQSAGNADNQPICHAKGNGDFEQATVDPDSIVNGTGHGGHAGDIIPAFDYLENGQTKHFPGQNLGNGGQAILDNGCKVPATTTTVARTTTTPAPTTTT